MTNEEFLRQALVGLKVNDEFSEAELRMRDGSRLRFCHRVGERWVKAERPEQIVGESCLAAEVLARMAMFRLNAKHLEIEFADGSRWEAPFRGQK